MPRLPGDGAVLGAALVGLYLIYTVAITWLHIIPWLTARLR